MSDYNFSTLNDKEFEELVKDLLNAKFKLRLQSFPAGRDKGIDLRYSTKNNNNSIIVQVKHYLNSGFSSLKNTLKNSELEKISKLEPDRYIVATSLELNTTKKDEVKEMLSPYILDSNDVIAQKDLNDYLGEFKDVEKKYYKLWLSSSTILEAIFNKAIDGRTKYFLEQLKLKIKFYVSTERVDEANEILKNQKILLITGQPGMGKTTLAEILIFSRAKFGYKIHKVEDLKEAEDLISYDINEKQIFYFDDFLGANYTEIINSQRTETRLTSFVERIYNTPNKYMILTTRTVVLNYANERYEKISHSKINSKHFELNLADYNKYDKALILYNHLYFRKIKRKYFNVVLKDKFYLKIIEHKNYTPRIIEFITEPTRINDFSSDQYLQFVINNLKNPKEIWRYSYNNQIEYLERCLLLTLFTFGNEIDERILIKSFDTRLEHEKNQNNQILESNQFNKSIKILLNGFISLKVYNYDSFIEKKYTFINPSLADFLINYLADSFSEKKSIVLSILYFEQLDRFNPKNSIIPFEKELQLILKEKILHNEIIFFEKKQDKNSKVLEIALIAMVYCKDIHVDDLLQKILKQLDLNIPFSYNNVYHSFEVLERINNDDYPFSFNFIEENFIKLIEKIFQRLDNELYAPDIIEIFEKFNVNFDEYKVTISGKRNLNIMLKNILESTKGEYQDNIEHEVLDIEDVEEMNNKVLEVFENVLNELGIEDFDNLVNEITVDEDFWNNKIEENILRNETSLIRKNSYNYDKNIATKEKNKNYDSEIEKLFR